MYGLIVVGDDLSSYLAAVIASSQGIKTALISENGVAGSCMIGGYAFNTDTTPLSGLGENQIFSSLLSNLGIMPPTRLLNPAYQIILPGHRLDFFHNKDELVKELAREFPDLASGIKSFYDSSEKNSEIAAKWLYEHFMVQPLNFKEYRDFLKLVPSFIRNKYNNDKLKRLMSRNVFFQKVMEAQNVLLSFRINFQTSIFSNIQYCAPLRGIYDLSKGKQDFFDSIIKKIEYSDGAHIHDCEVLSIKKGKFIEVTYMDKNGVASKIEANHLIVSTKWQNMRLVIERKKKFSLGDFIRPTRISRYPFTVHLGINAKCIPEKMAKHVAVINDIDKDIYDDNNLMILESGAFQAGGNAGSPSKVPLSVTAFLPDDQDIWTREKLIQRAKSLIGSLDDFLPFLRENIEFLDIEESVNVSQKQRDVMNPKYHIRNALITGFAAKNNKTKFKNIYLTGASLLTDAGFEGEIISGINAANCLTTKRK